MSSRCSRKGLWWMGWFQVKTGLWGWSSSESEGIQGAEEGVLGQRMRAIGVCLPGPTESIGEHTGP